MLVRVFLIICLTSSYSFAITCDNSSDQTEINTAISNATPGDTITIDAGTCDIDGTIDIGKAITLQGAGIGSTTFTIAANPAIDISLSSDVQVKIAGIHFDSSSYLADNSKTINITGSVVLSEILIGDNKFTNSHDAVYTNSIVYGVGYNNFFIDCEIGFRITSGSMEDDSWDLIIESGTANSFFVEDNMFQITGSFPGAFGSGPEQQVYLQEGGRNVTRCNTFTSIAGLPSAPVSGCNDPPTAIDSTRHESDFVPWDHHGNQSYYPGDFRGNPISEVYKNTFLTYESYAHMTIRSGSLLIYDNVFTTQTSTNQVIYLDEGETWETGRYSPLDTTWPTEDAITNVFYWDNTESGPFSKTWGVSGSQVIKFEADGAGHVDVWLNEPELSGGYTYYDDRQGASGRGADGTLNWNGDHANAYYPYTPYAYPHPLRGESFIQKIMTFFRRLRG